MNSDALRSLDRLWKKVYPYAVTHMMERSVARCLLKLLVSAVEVITTVESGE